HAHERARHVLVPLAGRVLAQGRYFGTHPACEGRRGRLRCRYPPRAGRSGGCGVSYGDPQLFRRTRGPGDRGGAVSESLASRRGRSIAVLTVLTGGAIALLATTQPWLSVALTDSDAVLDVPGSS